VRVRAVFQTAVLSPWKSVEVYGSPLVSRVTGARLAHRRDATRSLERQRGGRGASKRPRFCAKNVWGRLQCGRRRSRRRVACSMRSGR
jgi:hypothetical protein